MDKKDLRNYLKDYAGTAAFSGFPGAMMDLIDLDTMDDEELVEKARELGVDLDEWDDGGWDDDWDRED